MLRLFCDSDGFIGPFGIDFDAVDGSDTSDFIIVAGAFSEFFGIFIALLRSCLGGIESLVAIPAVLLCRTEHLEIVHLESCGFLPFDGDRALLCGGRRFDGRCLDAIDNSILIVCNRLESDRYGVCLYYIIKGVRRKVCQR